MGGLSIWHWMIVLVVVLVLFGGGSKISGLMGDFAKGIKSFKKNMAEDESMEHGREPTAVPPPLVGQQTPYRDPSSTQAAAQPAPPPPVEPARHPG